MPLDFKTAASNLIDAGASDDEIKSVIGTMKQYAGSLIDQGKSDKDIEDVIGKSKWKNTELFKSATPPATPITEPKQTQGVLPRALEAVVQSPGKTASLVEPATAESSTFGKIARPVARTALGALGTVFAPAAGIGNLARQAAEQIPIPEKGMMGLPAKAIRENLPGFVDVATQAALPTGIASGGIVPLVSKVGKLAGEMALARPVAQAVAEAGGRGKALTTIAENLQAPASAENLMQAGQATQAAQKVASAGSREAASKLYNQALAQVPEGASVSSDFAKVVESAKPALPSTQTTAGRKLENLAAEVGGEGNATKVKIGRGAQATEFKDLSPDLQRRVTDVFGQIGDARQIDFPTATNAKQALSKMRRAANTDDDRRLITQGLNAIESDLSKFGPQYPEAIQTYKRAEQVYGQEVAQFHGKGAPLRDLVVDAKNQPLPASEIVDNLIRTPVEHIANVVTGLSQAGAQGKGAIESLGNSVVGSLMTKAIDPISHEFQASAFVKSMEDSKLQLKLANLLPPEKHAALQQFTETVRQILNTSGEKAFKGNTMLKTMGTFHLIRGIQEAIIGLPMALYQFSAAGTMLLTPKLAGMMAQGRASAPLLAQLMSVQPSTSWHNAAQVLGHIAKGTGAMQIPVAVGKAVAP